MSHYRHSHAHFDEPHNETHPHPQRFTQEGYSNNRFSADGYSNERFNADALEEDEADEFFDDEDHQTPNEAAYGHAFSHEAADKYFSHEHNELPQVSHEPSQSRRPSMSAHKHRNFSDVVPSKTLFGPAFSHSFGERPQTFEHDNDPKSYSQTAEFDADDQLSNDFSEVQVYSEINSPSFDVVHETMSTQTVETKKPHKVTPIMQKCRIISDVTKNYFAECCLNRKHEVPTRDYGFVPACSPGCVHSSSFPMSVNEIQNRQNLLRMHKHGPVEIHCFNSNSHKKAVLENEELSFGTDEFPEVSACHNINNFNEYQNPSGSFGSSGSFSICVEPKNLKSCLCKKQTNGSYQNQSGSLRGGGVECKKVRLNPCTYKQREDFEKRSTSNSNRSNLGDPTIGGGRCKCKNTRLNSRPSPISEVDESESPLAKSGRGNNTGSLRSGSNSSIYGSDDAYRLSHNLDNKKPSQILCDCSDSSNGSAGSGSRKISNSGIEIHINTCCTCKNTEGLEKRDQNNGCNLCCSAAEKRECGNSKSDLYYLCKKEVTKTSGFNLHSSDYLSSGQSGRSRSHGDLYCLCSPKTSTASSRTSCCCKNNKCGRAKSNNDLLRSRCPCGCCCQKNVEQKSRSEIPKNQHNNKCKCGCSCNVTASKSSTNETSTSESDTESQKKKQPRCCKHKQPFQIEFEDDGSDNQIPIIKVCLCRKPQVTTGTTINSNPSALIGTDDIYCEDQNKINNYMNGSKNNSPSIMTGTDDLTNSSWMGSSGGVHKLTNSFNNSVCTSTNILAKDKSMQAISRKDDQMSSAEEDSLPIVFCNRKCSQLDQDLYEGPFEVETCNPFYITESQLRVHYKGSEVNILYASNLYSDGCNQTTNTQDHSCTANLSDGSSTSDSLTINEIHVPVLRDQEIQVAQTKHKTRINIVKPKTAKVCQENRKIYCCDPSGTEELSPCLEKIRPKCQCSEEDEPRLEACKCGQRRVTRDLSEEAVRKAKCKCSAEDARKKTKEEKKAPCVTRRKCKYIVVNSKGEVQSGQVRKSSSVELYCAFLKRAEVVFLVCSMLFYVFIYKMLTSYAL